MAYPESLPTPQTSAVTSDELRYLSNESRPREAAPIQLDGRDYESLTWPPMGPEQMAVFLSWVRNDLVFGGAWFTATWPLPRGQVAAVRKFIGQPRREFVPGGYWRVSAVCEIRGSGVFPSEPVEGSGGPWLFFDGGEPSAPIFRYPYVDLTGLGPVPFEDGVSVTNNDEGSNTVFQSDYQIPFFSDCPIPGEGKFSWVPVDETPPDSGDPENPTPPYPVPAIYDAEFDNPAPTEWAAANRILYLNHDGFAVTVDFWPGGVFTLFTNNDATGASGATVITFLAGTSFYPPVSIEYVGPA